MGEKSCFEKKFGSIDQKEKSLLPVVIILLEKLENDTRVKLEARVNAKGNRESFLKYETILTTYLQTNKIDILTIKLLKKLKN